MSQIGDSVREVRERRGLSQNALAELAEVKQPTLQRIEAGTRIPGIYTVAKIATALDVSIDHLVWQMVREGGRISRPSERIAWSDEMPSLAESEPPSTYRLELQVSRLRKQVLGMAEAIDQLLPEIGRLRATPEAPVKNARGPKKSR